MCWPYPETSTQLQHLRISGPSPDGPPNGPPNDRPRGIVHHVLKGCHPFDIASLGLEAFANIVQGG